MMRRPNFSRTIAFVVAPLLLASCAGVPEDVPPPPPPPVVPPPAAPPPAPPPPAASPPAPDAASGPAVVPVGEHRVARAYLWPGQAFVPGGGELPNGVLLLRAADADKNAAVCDAFVATLTPETEIRAADPAAKIVSTFWLMKTGAAAAGLDSCATLLPAYDFTRAATERARYGLAATAGPALLLVQDDGRYVAISLAASSPADIAVILPAWFETVVAANARTQPAPGAPTLTFVVAPAAGATVTPPAVTAQPDTDDGPPSLADLACAAATHVQRRGGLILSLIGAAAGSLVCRDEEPGTAAT